MVANGRSRPTETDFERADGLAKAMLDALRHAADDEPYAAAHILAATGLFEVDVIGRVLQMWRDEDSMTKEQATTLVARHVGMVMEGLAEVIENLWKAPPTGAKRGRRTKPHER